MVNRNRARQLIPEACLLTSPNPGLTSMATRHGPSVREQYWNGHGVEHIARRAAERTLA